MISQFFTEHIEVMTRFSTPETFRMIQDMADICIRQLQDGKKILLCGNGGSAADSQHIAAEMTGRYKRERRSLPAIALSTDTSALTAIGNDYSYDEVFSRQVEGLANPGDILIGISTSGNSKNIIRAVEMGKTKGVITLGLLGKGGGLLSSMVDYALIVPSDNTPRIQEGHILAYHSLCEIIDNAF